MGTYMFTHSTKSKSLIPHECAYRYTAVIVCTDLTVTPI